MEASLTEIPTTRLKGVGPKLQEKLAGLGVSSVADVLFHLPFRYQDRTRITPIAAMQADQDCVIEGEIRLCDISYGKRRALVCKLQDQSGVTSLRFFHFSAYQKSRLEPGQRLRCFGIPRRGPSGLEMFHPEYQLVENDQAPIEQSLTPIYPSTEGIHQASWRKLSEGALTLLNERSLPDLLPLAQGPSLEESLRYLHQPPVSADLATLAEGIHPCQQRLACEELVAHHLSLLQLRLRAKSQLAPAVSYQKNQQNALLKQTGFQPTAAQQRVATEIATDMAEAHPMLRLVQGDVGSGKTLVAAMAAVQAIAAGYQVTVMAPTEILAEQHLHSFQQWLGPMGYSVAWLAGKQTAVQRREQLAKIESGEASLIVGTHALIQDKVIFHRLGMLVIDEQHRFGVHQRLQLREKGHQQRDSQVFFPHQLIMTATPIPRTLAMTAYADLDCSVIDELPPGRQPVQTLLVSNTRREEVIDRVSSACREGEQAYWVCTLVEESEMLQAQAAEASWQQLQELLPDLSIGLVHGRLKAAEKSAVMADFKAGKIQLLVATTVIEVGVDVPNASLMVIENPERLGLAQLHQLRGRVGRGTKASHCVLLYQQPLSNTAKQRLQAMRHSNDGFYIAQQDLEIRGPGEVLGTRQTGEMNFRIADLLRDGDLLDVVKDIAGKIDDPDQAQALIRRWLPLGTSYAQA